MKTIREKELKIYDKQLRRIIERYKVCSLKISHKENWVLNPSQNKRIDYVTNKKYVEAVDWVLKDINPEYSKLITDVYINDKHRNELYYSSSTYYVKVRQAAKSFLAYFN
ncbi:MAG: hypothetical protein LBV37_02220 [Mycoplasmataceae bacterium]|jgi:hypothetical protein|nr:hypothetical protein [Mycoplasmataceae bacterium]